MHRLLFFQWYLTIGCILGGKEMHVLFLSARKIPVILYSELSFIDCERPPFPFSAHAPIHLCFRFKHITSGKARAEEITQQVR